MTPITEKNFRSIASRAATNGLPQDLADRVTWEAYVLSATACNCGCTWVGLRNDHAMSCVRCEAPENALINLPTGRCYPGVVVRVDGRDALRAAVVPSMVNRGRSSVERKVLLVSVETDSYAIPLGSRAKENSSDRLGRLVQDATRCGLGLIMRDGILAYSDGRRLDGLGFVPFTPLEEIELFCEQIERLGK